MDGGVPLIRRQIEARIRALDEERRALEKALAALADVRGPEPDSVRQRPGQARARRGENLEKILPLVTATPHLAPKEIADLTGIDARVVSATLSKLRREGRLGPQTREGS